jgi:hypothetical protein
MNYLLAKPNNLNENEKNIDKSIEEILMKLNKLSFD